MIDLIDARIDIALRVGKLSNSDWVARRLCDFETVLCASPAYAERQGIPRAPSDLEAHQWITVSQEIVASSPQANNSPHEVLKLRKRPQTANVTISPRIICTNQVAARQMCEQGAGMARMIYSDVMPSLESGALVRLLPAWKFDPMPVMMVMRPREGRPAKVRIASQALRRHFADLKSIPESPGMTQGGGSIR